MYSPGAAALCHAMELHQVIMQQRAQDTVHHPFYSKFQFRTTFSKQVLRCLPQLLSSTDTPNLLANMCRYSSYFIFHVRPRFLLTMIHSSPEYCSTLDSFCTAGYCIVVPPPDMQQYTSSLSPHCPQTPQHPLKKRFCHMSLSKSVK